MGGGEWGGVGVSLCVVGCGSVSRFGAIGELEWKVYVEQEREDFAVDLEERGVQSSVDEWTAWPEMCGKMRRDTLCV